MESQPQNPEFNNNLENFHPCNYYARLDTDSNDCCGILHCVSLSLEHEKSRSPGHNAGNTNTCTMQGLTLPAINATEKCTLTLSFMNIHVRLNPL